MTPILLSEIRPYTKTILRSDLIRRPRNSSDEITRAESIDQLDFATLRGTFQALRHNKRPAGVF